MDVISNIGFDKWIETMKSKMDFTYTNQIWILVDTSEGIKLIGCK
jgi:hypothetical protein